MNPWVVTAHTKPKQAQPGPSSKLEREGGHTAPPPAVMVLTIVSFREKERPFSVGIALINRAKSSGKLQI